MKRALCFFVITLTLLVYPSVQIMNPELIPFWGNIETDIFNWYRMILVCSMGLLCLFAFKAISAEVLFYLCLLLTSFFLSSYPEVGLIGSPNHHESLFVLIGYTGIYLAGSRTGIFEGLEKCLDVVVYLVFGSCLLQIWYGNFLDFFIFKWIFPESVFEASKWPLYGLTGNSNHLGLFTSLFIPYTFLRKKYEQCAILLLLLAGSQCRGALVSVVMTSCFLSKKMLTFSIMAGALILVAYPLKARDIGARTYIWRESVSVLKETLLIGKGPATFPLYFKQFQDKSASVGLTNVVVDRPHNMYINIWQNTGLISLFVIGVLVLRTILFSTDRSLSMGAVGFLIAGLFTDSVLAVTPYFLIFLGGMKHEYDEKRRLSKGTRGSSGGFSSVYGLLSFPDSVDLQHGV